ncbi:RusA family crossover junction endodeoxyribonuclease [Hathewaya histolytica]|uniref:Endodeoxyribonuclease n=1 Tax=Hathewaya histolytica TaxID=1498 RepID=A0A4U9RNY2_HATHI|nr:RusA family crossover junction endodeoxyribonuclease [Hathewaya histolytica]VTQ93952.1 endodeoxyribonuclease [Hathewaya histolytica]
MNSTYAKIIVQGSPISKSNFKLFNVNGRAILPCNSGKYHDRYALYEEEIALNARAQNPEVVIEESVIAILKVYYKSSKRHPDTNNITKSIFDGVEKSGLIINDAQIRRIIIEEFYDKENPRFELELFAESKYNMQYNINLNSLEKEPILYSPPPNSKKNKPKALNVSKNNSNSSICNICNKTYSNSELISADKGKTLICKSCFKKLF